MLYLLFAPESAAAPLPDEPPSLWQVALVASSTVELPPPPPPPPAPRRAPEGVKQAIEAEFGVGHIMYWVALNESELDPTASNPSGAKGLFQIVGITWRAYKCEGDVFNAHDNIACARKIYDANGLKDWRWSQWHGADGGWGKHI